MLTMSKAVSAPQATEYYRNEYTNPGESYDAKHEHVEGRWHGRQAERWGLRGEVTAEQYERLCAGQHPETGEQLVRHVEPRTYENFYGEEVTSAAHRAGWDATFSAPKTVSLAAVAGGDERVREAHRESVDRALNALESHAQARMGGNRPAETTGRIVAARFEHDAARPDRAAGYAAPQLHTHAVIFNVTETEAGAVKPVQPLELYRSQQYATAVYRISLAERLQRLGYEVEVDARTGAPEIKGFDPEYVRESSPRSAELRRGAEEMRARLEGEGVAVKDGAGLKQAAARAGRAGKDYDRRAMAGRVAELEAKYGHQARRLYAEALERGPVAYEPADVSRRAAEAMTTVRERTAALGEEVDRRRLMADALREGLRGSTYEAVTAEFEARAARGEFRGVVRDASHSRTPAARALQEEPGAPGHSAERSVNVTLAREERRQPLVRKLSADEVQDVFERLRGEGRAVELPDREARVRAVVEDYCSSPEGALVVAPADERLDELNRMIRDALRAEGRLGDEERAVKVYEERVGMKGDARAAAGEYVPGEDVVRFGRSSKTFGVEAGEYARVTSADPARNLLTVATQDGREVTYSPTRLSGVRVLRESERAFAEGDRVRFDMPSTGHRVSAGTLGTIERLEDGGGMSVRLNGGRAVGLGADDLRHLDYGYAVGDFAPKDSAVGRLLAHIEGGEPDAAVNQRMQLVAQEQFRDGARVYTDDSERLGATLERNVERQFAGDPPKLQKAVSGVELDVGGQVGSAEQAVANGLELGFML
ncbi:MAG TPA: MobF family relaxase [Pyrinomonadaceae bacterium]